MVVYVKIDRSHIAGRNPILGAWRTWKLSRLLTDTTFRNSAKYLVAIYNKEIIETYCIKAVAPDGGTRVKFAVVSTDSNCDNSIRSSVAVSLPHINSIRRSCGYIPTELKCSCECEENLIQVVLETDIINGILK